MSDKSDVILDIKGRKKRREGKEEEKY